MKSADEAWEGIAELEPPTTVIPEGERGTVAPRQRLTAERLDAIALFFAAPPDIRECAPDWLGPRNLRALAADVGCSPLAIDRWMKNPRMVERVGEMLHAAAVYAMPQILWGQITAASPHLEADKNGVERWVAGDTKAANFVATVAKFMRTGSGTQVTMNQNNVTPVGLVGPDDDELEKRMIELMERRVQSNEGEEEDR